MKKISRIFIPIISLALALPISSYLFTKHKEVVAPDDVVYDDPLVKDANDPDITYEAPKPMMAKATTGFTVHYHHDDGKCGNRELWVWCDGVNGSGYDATSVSKDGKDMTVVINFTGENAKFNDKIGISFIIKEKGTWLGQSQNINIKYSEYKPDDNGMSVVWCIPGEGNMVEVYHTEKETLMDRFVIAQIEKDWRTITITATAKPMTYRLYALTGYYTRWSGIITPTEKEKYLIASGSNPTTTKVVVNGRECQRFTIRLNYTAKVNVLYNIEGIFPEYQSYTKSKYVSSSELYETTRFKTWYEYDGDDLGATYTPTATTFKVWAPTACRVRLLVYKSGIPATYKDDAIVPNVDGVIGNDNYVGYNMAYTEHGVWQVTITNKDCDGMYYNYYVENSLGEGICNDPYAKACGVNGARSMVCDFSKTNPDNWDSLPLRWHDDPKLRLNSPNELSIYETHIRDLTMDSTWNGEEIPGTYSAFVESHTSYKKGSTVVTTGFDHLKEMGYSAIHLLPVFDSDNNEELKNRHYNWGYNPLNYNCVDGSYATDPYDGASRIKEFKELIYKFAKNNDDNDELNDPTRIIMDVVYNHVSSAPASCFNRLMPKYYFRIEKTTQSYYDGSGCGNEVKTEATMMSKYIVDSLVWWATEYKIKGFRFDLMGCIDYQTMQKVARALYKVDPDIYIYGEGWTSGGCNMDNKNPGDPYFGNWGSDTWTVYNKILKEPNSCYVGCFNDGARNALRGKSDINVWGFIGQGTNDVGEKSKVVADMLVGYHSQIKDDGGYELIGTNPNQCVNYASCHDNFALFDQLTYTIGADGTNDYPGVPCAGVTACECAVLYSNGVALINGGEDVFRTKVVTDEDYNDGLAKESDTHWIHGKRISHNSYNLCDETNAFKWDRKISIDGVNTLKYVQEMKKAVRARREMAKYAAGQFDPYSSSSPLNVWGQGGGSTVIGAKNGDYFFFLAGVNSDNISFDAISSYGKVVYVSNPAPGGYIPGTNFVKLGWYTCVCLTKND